jgi:hypothetical protein
MKTLEQVSSKTKRRMLGTGLLGEKVSKESITNKNPGTKAPGFFI